MALRHPTSDRLLFQAVVWIGVFLIRWFLHVLFLIAMVSFSRNITAASCLSFRETLTAIIMGFSVVSDTAFVNDVMGE